MKLKTLKDLKEFDEEGNVYSETYEARTLKVEAVKWVKAIDKSNKDNYDLIRGERVDIGDLKDVEVDWEESSEMYGMIKILKHFFNLTEENLK